MKKKSKYLLIIALLFLTTGCTTYLKNDKGTIITNEKTGQNLVENILCRPEDEETVKLYEDAKYDLSKLPYCVCDETKLQNKVDDNKEETADTETTKNDTDKKDEKEKNTENETTEEVNENKKTCEELSVFHGKYESLWTNLFVKPLAWIILFCGKISGKFGLGLIITSILIRLVLYPLTKKSAVQTEKMKQIQPELNRLEKKYANKDQKDRDVMMQKSQEMMALYKKHSYNYQY